MTSFPNCETHVKASKRCCKKIFLKKEVQQNRCSEAFDEILQNREVSHPATRCCGDVVTTSLCMSQRHRRYVSNETPMTSQWNVVKPSQWYVFTTSYWYVVTTSQGDVMTTSHQYVSMTSQISLKWNTQQRLSGTSPNRLSGTYPRRPISTSLWCLLYLPNETPNKVAVVRLDHVSELRCLDALSLLRSLIRFQITLPWPVAGSFSRHI